VGDRAVTRVGSRTPIAHRGPRVCCKSRKLSHSASGGADRCVAIIDPDRFREELTAALIHELRGTALVWSHRLVRYREPVLDLSLRGKIHPAFSKDDKFSFEGEYRMIWEAAVLPEMPYLDLQVPGLRQFVRHVDIPAATE
jgi:hypothetical protein